MRIGSLEFHNYNANLRRNHWLEITDDANRLVDVRQLRRRPAADEAASNENETQPHRTSPTGLPDAAA